MKIKLRELLKQDLIDKTIRFDLVAGQKGEEGRVYKDCGHCCLVDVFNGYGPTYKTIVLKSEITKVLEEVPAKPYSPFEESMEYHQSIGS